MMSNFLAGFIYEKNRNRNRNKNINKGEFKFMNKSNKGLFVTAILLSGILAVFIVIMSISAILVMAESDQAPVELGTTSSFAVLAGSTITNTGDTTINGDAGGDIGLFPGTSFTGQESMIIEGSIHVNDAVASKAKDDLLVAYTDAENRTPVNTIPSELGGTTLLPGVYDSADGTFQITGTLTLDAQGNPDAVFVFKTASTLITASDSNVILADSAQYCRIFWQVTSSVTLGTNSNFVGHVFALHSITANTGATVQGQLLAINGAVTLDNNIITNGICEATAELTPTPPITEIPQTGQTSNYSLAIILGSLAILILGAGTIASIKKNKSNA